MRPRRETPLVVAILVLFFVLPAVLGAQDSGIDEDALFGPDGGQA